MNKGHFDLVLRELRYRTEYLARECGPSCIIWRVWPGRVDGLWMRLHFGSIEALQADQRLRQAYRPWLETILLRPTDYVSATVSSRPDGTV